MKASGHSTRTRNARPWMLGLSIIAAAFCHPAFSEPTPVRDSDHDGFEDSQDACPRRPESMNGILDEDGCPDAPAYAREQAPKP